MTGTTFYLDFEPALMRALQALFGPAAEPLCRFFSAFGEETVIIAVLGFIYWCVDKEYGKFLGTNIVCCLVWNPMIKNVVLRRRPYMDHPSIRCLKPVEPDADLMDIAAQGYSFPSGHSTNAAVLYGSLPLYKGENGDVRYRDGRGRRAAVAAAFIMPLLVGFGRVLAGVHYPTDVLCGWLLGGCAAVGVSFLQVKVRNENLLHLVLFLTALPGFFCCVTDDYFTSLGVMAGFFLAVPFERKFVNFAGTKNPVLCVIRVLGGIAVYFILNTLLKLPFSSAFLDSGTFAAHLVRTLRYTVVLFAMIGPYPMLFGRFRKKAA